MSITLPFPIEEVEVATATFASTVTIEPTETRKITEEIAAVPEVKLPGYLGTRVQQVLEKFTDEYPELENVLVASTDGFDIASVVKENDEARIHRLAAITSSMLSLSREILAEMRAGEQKMLTLEGSKGTILISHAETQHFILCITVITSANHALGQLFWLLRQLTNDVEDICNNIDEHNSLQEDDNE